MASDSLVLVGLIMGSRSDWDTMRHTAAMLISLEIPHEVEVVSAHRTPDKLFDYAEGAESRGLEVIIAGAGGAAHLPGMLAAKTTVPVLGVPVASKHLSGLDSLYSIVQMPKGVPVATFAIGPAGAANAALFAVALLAAQDDDLLRRLQAFRARQTAAAFAMTDDLSNAETAHTTADPAVPQVAPAAAVTSAPSNLSHAKKGPAP
jgi:5-(carboxyamino)imidazole ribonucleotide mutase